MQAGQRVPSRKEMGDNRRGVAVCVDSLGGLIALIDRFFHVPPECLRLGPQLCVEESSPWEGRQLERHRHAEDVISSGNEIRREEMQAAAQSVVRGGHSTLYPDHVPIPCGPLDRQRHKAEADGDGVDQANPGLKRERVEGFAPAHWR